MYNEELEMLIDAALADGVLTDSEKQILFKKAQSFGLDLDEFNMVLEGRLAKVKEQRQAASKSNKQGAVKKCPACGAFVQQMQIKCPECGYEFRDIEACSTTKELQKKLDEIASEASNHSVVSSISARLCGTIDKVTTRKIQTIKNWPVPNTKEDLIEMLILCNSNRKIDYGSDVETERMIASAWNAKFKQVMSKAKIMLKDDPEGQAVIQEIEAAKAKKRKLILYSLIAGIIVAAVIAISVTRYVHSEKEEVAELKEIISKAESFVLDGDCKKAAIVLSFCKVDVTENETSALYASAVSKVAGTLLEEGDTAQARTLYDSAIAKLGRYNEDKLDSLAKRLGLGAVSTDNTEKKDLEETQSEDVTDGEATLDENEDGWLDRQIDKAADKLNKEIEKEVEKLTE